MNGRRVRVLVALAVLAGLGLAGWAVATNAGNRDHPVAAATGVITVSPAPTVTVSRIPQATTTPTVAPTRSAPSQPSTTALETPSVAPKAVTLVVTFSQWDAASATAQVGAYVPGVVEAGGTCRLEMRDGAVTVRATSDATPDASTTSCGILNASGMVAGTWEGTVSYESPTSAGQSPSFTIAIP